jgi:tetratricopeptide (TPR) repeat protein
LNRISLLWKAVLKKFIDRWAKAAPATLVIVIITLIAAAFCRWIFPQDGSMDGFFLMLMLVEVGYSFFVTFWNNTIISQNYDKRIIGSNFEGIAPYCRMFHRSYKQLVEGDIADALNGFITVKDSKIKKTEMAVVCYFLGRCYQHMGYPTNAANYFRESIDNGIGIDEVYTLCGREMVACGNFTAAEQVYNELLSTESKSDYIYTDIGMLFIKANEPEKALEAFSTSIKKHMNYAFAMGGCALAYVLKKDSANAKFFYGQAIINNIDDVEGFTEYYLSVAETQGLSDDIGIKPKPKLYIDPAKLTGGDD